MLPIVIIVKRESGYFTHIAYFMPKLFDGFVHRRFINNPAPEYLNLIF